MPYIKLEDLQKFPIRKDHYDKEHGNEHFIFGVETVFEFVEYLPTYDITPITNDAVEVVRCRDCRWYNVKGMECHHPNCNGFTGLLDYCSRGERRE